MTQSKLDTLRLFLKSKIPLGSKDIINKLSTYNESTVFRNLIKFKECGILEEIDLNEGYKRYVLRQGDHHHHYAKCNICEEIIRINSCSINSIEKELNEKHQHTAGLSSNSYVAKDEKIRVLELHFLHEIELSEIIERLQKRYQLKVKYYSLYEEPFTYQSNLND